MGRDSTALNHTAPGPPHTQILQVKCAQCVFDSVSEPNDSVLHIAAEQNNKGIALPEDLRSSHRTGTAWVIDTKSAAPLSPFNPKSRECNSRLFIPTVKRLSGIGGWNESLPPAFARHAKDFLRSSIRILPTSRSAPRPIARCHSPAPECGWA